MSLTTDIKTFLESDGTLMGILTGGIHDAVEISRQETPTAFDANLELLPCGLVKVENEVPFGRNDTSTRAFVLISLYERSGYTNIYSAINRVFTILHRQNGIAGTVDFRLVGETPDQHDPALDSSLALIRYQASRTR